MTDDSVAMTDDVTAAAAAVVRLIITRRVAVYLETHCNIGSKRAFTTGILDR